MTLKQRIEKALEDFTKGRASMHVPPLDTDVDVVLAECSDRLPELEARCLELAAENAGLKSNLRALFDSCDTGERRGNGSMSGSACPEWHILELTRQFLEETPATDAFLAEVRAQGVEMLLDVYRSRWISPHVEDADRFAAQLRKGVQS